MKKLLIIAAAILAANVMMITSVKSDYYQGKVWLVVPSHFSANGWYQPTVVRTFTDNGYLKAGEQCVLELDRIGNKYPWSMCSSTYKTVQLFTRLY